MGKRDIIEDLYNLALGAPNLIPWLHLESDEMTKKADALLEKYEEFLPKEKRFDYSSDCCDYAYFYGMSAFKNGFIFGARLMSGVFSDE